MNLYIKNSQLSIKQQEVVFCFVSQTTPSIILLLSPAPCTQSYQFSLLLLAYF